MKSEPWRRLVSADGTVALALHRFAEPGPDRPPDDQPADRPVVLLSHATGFHGHCYRAIAEALPSDWFSVGVDHRGHGYTAPDPNDDRTDGLPEVDWAVFGVDTATTATWLRDRYRPDRLIGFGHSMGASALVLAAAQHPELFSALVLFEPIAPSGFLPAGAAENPAGNQLAIGAARRRRTFESVDAAVANYAAKPPLNAFAPEVLRDYVTHGFAPAPDGVTLRCVPEYEAATFNSALTNGVWEAMPDITTPTIVAAGANDPDQPGSWAPAIAERIPTATLVVFDDQDHFGPFTRPGVIASLIERAAGLD